MLSFKDFLMTLDESVDALYTAYMKHATDTNKASEKKVLAVHRAIVAAHGEKVAASLHAAAIARHENDLDKETDHLRRAHELAKRNK